MKKYLHFFFCVWVGFITHSASAQLVAQIDSTFNYGQGPGYGFNAPSGTESISKLFVQRDNKIIVAGGFVNFQGHKTYALARLMPDGRVDKSFQVPDNLELSFTNTKLSIFQLPNNKLVVGGFVLKQNSSSGSKPSFSYIHFFNPDGSLDTASTNKFAKLTNRKKMNLQEVLPSGELAISDTITPQIYYSQYNSAYYIVNYDLDAISKPSLTNRYQQQVYHKLTNTWFIWDNELKQASADLSDLKSIPFTNNIPYGNMRNIFAPDDGYIYVRSSETLYRFTPYGVLDTLFKTSLNKYSLNYFTGLVSTTDNKIILYSNLINSTYYKQNCLRLNNNGSIDSTFKPLPKGFTIFDIVPYKNGFLVGNKNNQIINEQRPIIKINSDGDIDSTFGKPVGLSMAIIPNVWFTIINSLDDNGRVLIGNAGHFNEKPIPLVARLLQDGSLDTSFAKGLTFKDTENRTNLAITSMVLDSKKRWMVTGNFVSCNGRPAPGLVRLLPSGVPDTTFKPTYSINSVFILSKKRYLACNLSRNNVANLNVLDSTGKIDSTFNISFLPGFTKFWPKIAKEMPNGNILLLGSFINTSGVWSNLVRLLPNGGLDTSFAPIMFSEPRSGGGDFLFLDVTKDNKIYVGGSIEYYHNKIYPSIIRFDSRGRLDTSFFFSFNYVALSPTSFCKAPDDKVYISGYVRNQSFSISESVLIRVNIDGMVDQTFTTGPDALDAPIYSMNMQPDGKLVASGNFTLFKNTYVTPYVTRIITDPLPTSPVEKPTPPAPKPIQKTVLAPNPASSYLSINNTLAASARYTLKTALGAALLQGQVPQGVSTISLAGIAPGIYVVEIEGLGRHRLVKE